MVADTVWSAFADASPEEWQQFLRHRSSQGFTHLLISILPILHDRSVTKDAREPFAVDAEGRYDYSKPNDTYFDAARRMVASAKEEGLQCALVLLWCCYVPGTWGAEITPWAPMSSAERDHYLDLALDRFADLDPMFIVSGDDGLTLDSANSVYHDVLRRVVDTAPTVLTTMHSTPQAALPPAIADDPSLSYYSYQSGHHFDQQSLTWELARQYRELAVRRPIVNFEPCYEGHGYGGGGGRWNRAQVRAASWSSVFGGASAGIGYGAHGLWQWHRPQASFTNPGFSLAPFLWEVALQFPAADDVVFAARVIAECGLIGADPAQELLTIAFPGVCAVLGRAGELGVYLPYAGEIEIDGIVESAQMWNLEARCPISPCLRYDGGRTIIAQAETPGDVVLSARLTP